MIKQKTSMEKKQELPDNEKTVFIPAEDIRVIERVLNNWEQVKQEFYNVEAEKKRNQNGETKIEN